MPGGMLHHCSQNTFGGAAQLPGLSPSQWQCQLWGAEPGSSPACCAAGHLLGAVTIPWHLEHVGSYPCSALQLTGVCAAINISINSHSI